MFALIKDVVEMWLPRLKVAGRIYYEANQSMRQRPRLGLFGVVGQSLTGLRFEDADSEQE